MVDVAQQELYKLNNKSEDRTFFYARNQQHIIDLIRKYRTERLTPEDLKHPDILSWAKKEPELSDIIVETEGFMGFVGSMIDTNKPGDVFDVRLQVTPDFVVGLPSESLPAFRMWRMNILARKRGELYKAHVNHALFGAQYFIPEDVAQAIASYDLIPEMEKASEAIEKIAEVRRGHPNIG